jgi:hypothetical protein
MESAGGRPSRVRAPELPLVVAVGQFVLEAFGLLAAKVLAIDAHEESVGASAASTTR